MKKYEIVKENGKFYMKSERFFGWKGKAMIYKVSSENPYVRFAGYFCELDEEMKQELKRVTA